jgi:hypothetical protein
MVNLARTVLGQRLQIFKRDAPHSFVDGLPNRPSCPHTIPSMVSKRRGSPKAQNLSRQRNRRRHPRPTLRRPPPPRPRSQRHQHRKRLKAAVLICVYLRPSAAKSVLFFLIRVLSAPSVAIRLFFKTENTNPRSSFCQTTHLSRSPASHFLNHRLLNIFLCLSFQSLADFFPLAANSAQPNLLRKREANASERKKISKKKTDNLAAEPPLPESESEEGPDETIYDPDRPKKRNSGKTGPTSAAGRAKSAQNARRHGACARTLILPYESPEGWELLLARWHRTYTPEDDSLAADFVLRTAQAEWQRIRTQHSYDDFLKITAWSPYARLLSRPNQNA